MSLLCSQAYRRFPISPTAKAKTLSWPSEPFMICLWPYHSLHCLCYSWNTPGELPQGLCSALASAWTVLPQIPQSHSPPSSLCKISSSQRGWPRLSLSQPTTCPLSILHPPQAALLFFSHSTLNFIAYHIIYSSSMFVLLFFPLSSIPINPQPEWKLQSQGSLSVMVEPKHLCAWVTEWVSVCENLCLPPSFAGLWVIFPLLKIA